MSKHLNRRRFLERLGGVTAATLATGVVGIPSFVGTQAGTTHAAGMDARDTHDRRWQAKRKSQVLHCAGL